jgi:hypothetical protein
MESWLGKLFRILHWEQNWKHKDKMTLANLHYEFGLSLCIGLGIAAQTQAGD